jgi:hypothetical protein
MPVFDFNLYNLKAITVCIDSSQYTFLNAPTTMSGVFTFTAIPAFQANKLQQIIIMDSANIVYTREYDGEIWSDWITNSGGGDVLGTLLTGLTSGIGRIVATDTILEAFSKLSYAPSFVGLDLTSNGDTLVMGTYPNQISLYIGGVTGNMNRATFPGGNVTSTTIIGNDSPASGTALSNIGTNGIQNSIMIINQLLTGLSITNSAITATDSILSGFGKAQGQLNSKLPNMLTMANLLVGNASNIATAVSPTGAVSMSDLGVFTLTPGINALDIAAGLTNNTDFNNLSGTTANIQMQISALAAGLDIRGGYDASSNLFPSTGGSGVAGAIQAGDFWYITVGGVLGGVTVDPGALITALVNLPGQTSSNWGITATTVTSVFGRMGAVIANTGDYNISQITDGLSRVLATDSFYLGVGGVATATVFNTAVLNQILTGFVPITGQSVNNTDTVLQSIEKLAGTASTAYNIVYSSTTYEFTSNTITLVLTENNLFGVLPVPTSDFIPGVTYTLKLGPGITQGALGPVAGTLLDGSLNPFILSGANNAVSFQTDGANWITVPANYGQKNMPYGIPGLDINNYMNPDLIGYGVPKWGVQQANYVANGTWNANPTGIAAPFSSLCYSENLGLLVSVTDSNSGVTATSSDGVNWISGTAASASSWNEVCYSPELGLFVAVGSSDPDGIMTSPDGVTWTIQSNPDSNTWQCVCWAAELGIFVALADNNVTNGAMISNDGVIWTTVTASVLADSWFNICYSPELNLLVGVALSGSIITSPDGMTWTSQTSPIMEPLTNIVWANRLGLFVGIAAIGGGNQVITSPDGITWTLGAAASSNVWVGLAYSPMFNLLAAVSLDGAIMTSFDGMNWTLQTSPAANAWLAICFVPELARFITLSNGGETNNSMTSSSAWNFTYAT